MMIMCRILFATLVGCSLASLPMACNRQKTDRTGNGDDNGLDTPANDDLPFVKGEPPVPRAPVTPDVAAVAKGNNEFAIDLYKQLAKNARPDENIIFSPYSISTALAMTYAG